MEDITWRCNSIKEAIEEYDCRKNIVCKDTVREYSEAMTSLNQTITDLDEVKQSFTSWLGTHFRGLFKESKEVEIWVNKDGSNVVFRGHSFDPIIFKELERLGMKYLVSSLEDGRTQIIGVIFE